MDFEVNFAMYHSLAGDSAILAIIKLSTKVEFLYSRWCFILFNDTQSEEFNNKKVNKI